jgi:ATPase subunit of ABC transporter with duplicated ATPase domains
MDPQSKASLEEILMGSRESVDAVLVISHDREFLERVTSRIVRIG